MDRAQVCSIIASNQVCQLSPTRLAIVSRTAHYCRPFRHQLSDDINQPNSTNLRFATDTLTFSCSLATIGRLEYSPPVKTDAQNRAKQPLTSDSTMRKAAAYFDAHRQNPQQMRAHYLLGCIYANWKKPREALIGLRQSNAAILFLYKPPT